MGILLFHGLTACPFELKELAIQLNTKGFRVHVPLLPGHGTHPKNLLSLSWQDWFEAAKKDLFALRKKCKKIIVGGLSTGASLALHLSAHYQVEGVIALSPGMFLKSKAVKLVPILRPFVRYHRKKNGPDIFDEEARRNSLGYKKIPVKSIIEAQNLYKHLQEDLPEIYVPVFLAQSINDHVVRYDGAEYIYRAVSSHNKQLLRLEKSYHVITQDVEKEIVTREILKFVKAIFG
ncbi:MAG TPA: alpha/beta fold hydrolase [Calditrichaeota bacterium]|nr:alpha/beta fold hydrolase [Calditrichota bacterium]